MLDSCQFRAKWGQDWVYCRLDISLKGSLDAPLIDVNEHDRELNDLLALHWKVLLVVGACTFEIEHANVVKRSLLDVSFVRGLEYVSEVAWRDRALSKNQTLASVKLNCIAQHCSRHVDRNSDLFGKIQTVIQQDQVTVCRIFDLFCLLLATQTIFMISCSSSAFS